MTRFMLLAAALLLAGCGLRPMYASGETGAVARGLHSVRVEPIPGRAGWLVRKELVSRLSHGDVATPRYRLEVELDDNITGFGIRGDRAATRERRTLRARYRLIDSASGLVVVDATAGSDAGIDVVSSQYATVAAEQSALERLSGVVADQIVGRLATFMNSRAGRP